MFIRITYKETVRTVVKYIDESVARMIYSARTRHIGRSMSDRTQGYAPDRSRGYALKDHRLVVI